MATNELMSRPIPLIQYERNGSLSINQDALSFLRSINSHVCVVGVAGMYRTGKSSLLNWIMESKDGFSVGSNINRHTRGIWIWGSTENVVYINGESCVVLYLDTEGFGAVESDPEKDAQIFSLVTLLSSMLLFNSQGSIDETAIGNLSFISQLTTLISISKEKNKIHHANDYIQYFPDLFWVLRDFSLDLSLEDGTQISPSQYLEQCLQIQRDPINTTSNSTSTSSSNNTPLSERNRVRQILTSYFPSRHCTALIRPTTDEEILQNVNNVPLDSLRKEFILGLSELKNSIQSHLKPKTVNGSILNGTMFSTLLEGYTNAINKGNIPTISTAWEFVSRNECKDAMETSIEVYTQHMEATCTMDKLPVEDAEIKILHQDAVEVAVAAYRKRKTGPHADVIHDQLQVSLLQVLETYLQRNIECSTSLSNKILHGIFNNGIRNKLNDKGLIEQYLNDLKLFEREWLELYERYIESARGPQKYICISEFLRDNSILCIESLLSKIRKNHSQEDILHNKMIKTLQSLLEEKTTDLNTHSINNRTLELKNKTLEARNSEISAELEISESKLEGLVANKVLLEKEIHDEKSSRLALEKQLHDIILENKKKNTENNQNNNSIEEELKLTISRLQSRLIETESQCSHLISTIESIKCSNDEISKESNKMANTIQKQEELISNQEKMILKQQKEFNDTLLHVQLEAEKKITDVVTVLEHRLADVTVELQVERGNVRMFQMERKVMEDQYKDSIAKLEENMERREAELRLKLQTSEDKMNEDKLNFARTLALTISDIETKHKTQNGELQAKIDLLKNTVDKLRKEASVAEKELEEREKDWQQRLVDIQDQHAQDILAKQETCEFLTIEAENMYTMKLSELESLHTLKLLEHEEKYIKLKNELENVTDELKSLQGCTMSKEKKYLQEINELKEFLSTERNSFQEQLTRLSTQLEEKSIELHEKSNELIHLQLETVPKDALEEFCQLQSDLEAAKNKIEKLENDLSRSSAEASLKHLDSYKVAKELSYKENESLKIQLHENINRINENEKKFKHMQEQLSNEKVELQAQLQAADKECQLLKLSIQDSQRNMIEIEEKFQLYGTVEVQVAQLEVELRTKTLKIEELSCENENLKTALLSKEAEQEQFLQKFHKRAIENTDEILQIKSSLDVLSEELKKEKEKNIILNTAKEQLESKLNKQNMTQSSRHDVDIMINSMNAKCLSKETEITLLNMKINDLLKTVSQQKKNSVADEVLITTAESKLEKYALLEEEFKKIQEELAVKNMKCNEYSEQILQLNNEIKSQEALYNTLKNQYTDESTKNINLNELINTLQIEINIEKENSILLKETLDEMESSAMSQYEAYSSSVNQQEMRIAELNYFIEQQSQIIFKLEQIALNNEYIYNAVELQVENGHAHQLEVEDPLVRLQEVEIRTVCMSVLNDIKNNIVDNSLFTALDMIQRNKRSTEMLVLESRKSHDDLVVLESSLAVGDATKDKKKKSVTFEDLRITSKSLDVNYNNNNNNSNNNITPVLKYIKSDIINGSSDNESSESELHSDNNINISGSTGGVTEAETGMGGGVGVMGEGVLIDGDGVGDGDSTVAAGDHLRKFFIDVHLKIKRLSQEKLDLKQDLISVISDNELLVRRVDDLKSEKIELKKALSLMQLSNAAMERDLVETNKYDPNNDVFANALS
eukprot:gene3173-6258_t